MVLNKVTRFYIFMAHGVVMSAQVELKRCPVFFNYWAYPNSIFFFALNRKRSKLGKVLTRS